MTETQAFVLREIEKFIKQNGFSPSYTEIATACGYNSLATVAKHLKQLSDQGLISYNYMSSRSIIVLPRPEIYGLNSCDKGHQQIFFRGKLCPLCSIISGSGRSVSVG